MAEKVDPFESMKSNEELEKTLKEFEERQRAEEAAEKERSKPLDQLVVSAYFTVDEVVGETYATSVTPESEMKLGGRSPDYNTGYTSQLVLKVTPDNPEILVQKLTFDGISPVRAGDYISATIPRYKEKKVWKELQNILDDGRRTLYFDRAFNPEESAIELTLLSEKGKVLRTDRAIHYSTFVKE